MEAAIKAFSTNSTMRLRSPGPKRTSVSLSINDSTGIEGYIEDWAFINLDRNKMDWNTFNLKGNAVDLGTIYLTTPLRLTPSCRFRASSRKMSCAARECSARTANCNQERLHYRCDHWLRYHYQVLRARVPPERQTYTLRSSMELIFRSHRCCRRWRITIADP
jgi:hypothetical protein